MASIAWDSRSSTTSRTDRLCRIIFKDRAGQRKAVRLGAVSTAYAETFRLNVERIVLAAGASAVDADVARWLNGLSDDHHKRLASTGLIEKRGGATTLSTLVERFTRQRSALKPNTRRIAEQAALYLVEHFGASRDVRSITKDQAKLYRAWLCEEGRCLPRRRKFQPPTPTEATKRPSLAQATISSYVKYAKKLFAEAVRLDLIASSPFDAVVAGSQSNRSRMHYVSREDTQLLIDACADSEWKLIIALSRYAGLRCPSEHLALRLSDVNWEQGRMTVPQPKLAHKGRGSRTCPIFPELQPYLLDSFEAAEPGQTYFITRYRDGKQNLRTQFQRIIKRAGLTAWPRLFHNLRSSCQTDLADAGYADHQHCAWLGNSPRVAGDSYLQPTSAAFDRATVKLARNPARAGVHGRSGRSNGDGETPLAMCKSKIDDAGSVDPRNHRPRQESNL